MCRAPLQTRRGCFGGALEDFCADGAGEWQIRAEQVDFTDTPNGFSHTVLPIFTFQNPNL